MPQTTCSIDGCERDTFSRGWCQRHYHAAWKYGDPLGGKPKPAPTCSIDGCERATYARTWCELHYNRWSRHGDPLLGRPNLPRGEARDYFYEHLYTEQDECKIWPYTAAATGYGILYIDRTLFYVHRLACQAWNGPPPLNADAAHGRDKRCESTLCFNGAHVRWASRASNMWDKARDGTQQRGEDVHFSRFTADQIMEIRTLYRDGTPQRTIARRFGVQPSSISLICSGGTWAHLPVLGGKRQFRSLALADRAEIIRLHTETGTSTQEIADMYGVTRDRIYRIVKRSEK